MSDRNDRTSGKKQICTCQGTCKGAAGLSARWQCALESQPPPLAVGQEVWVRATVKQVRPERDGFIDLDVQDYYYVSDDALDASDVEEIYIRVPANHVRPATG